MTHDTHPTSHDHGLDHDHTHGHGHRHDHDHSHDRPKGLLGVIKEIFAPHSHDASDSIDGALESSAAGIRAVKISLLALGATSIAQLVIVVISGSVALLADTIHNFSDALTAIPLWIAFALGTKAATRRYTYGYGRAEDLAGLFVIAMITLSAIIAGVESVRRLIHPVPIQHVGWVAAAGLVRPWQREVDFPGLSRGDVPDGEAAPSDQDPACLGVQAALVGHVHLDVLAGHHVEGGVGERQVGHVRLPDGDRRVKAGELVEPACCLAVLPGQVDGGHLAAVGGGEEPGGPADAGAGVEHPVRAGDPRQPGELPGGDPPHRVEVFERAEVRGRQVVDVLACGGEGLLDALAGQASRVLGADVAGCHGIPPFAAGWGWPW